MASSTLPAHIQPLPDFTKHSDRVWRVMGLNPGFFTLQGTNTYLVGAGPRKVLIDCGHGEVAYLPLLEESLKSISPDAYVSDILITHCHPDHWGGLESIYDHLGAPRVHKFPLPSGCPDEEDHMTGFPEEIPVSDLVDGQIFEIDSETTLEVVYTGGHSKDHCAFWLAEEESLFTGDCVLGHGTAVFDDLSEYLEGLHKMLSLSPKPLYPGHGPVIEDGEAKIKEYIQLRQQREEQILEVMRSQASKSWTSDEISTHLGVPEDEVVRAAHTRNIALHLLKLQKDGKARMMEGSMEEIEDILELVGKEWIYIGQSRL